jgi:hypothetical protein
VKEEKKPEEKDKPHYQEDNLYQKKNKLSHAHFDAITHFYKQIPKDTHEQFLKAISDKNSMQKLAASLQSSKTKDTTMTDRIQMTWQHVKLSLLPNRTLLRKTTKN